MDLINKHFEFIDDSYERNLATGKRVVWLLRGLAFAAILTIIAFASPAEADTFDEPEIFFSDADLHSEFFFFLLDNGVFIEEPELEPEHVNVSPQKEPAIAKAALFTPPKSSARFTPSSVSLVKNGPENVRRFIGRWCLTAKQEEKRTGIPASVKLAQAALESNWGGSTLVGRSNNYFGIKCHDKSHKKLGKNHHHCVQQHDDHAHDRFLKHATPWESWRRHSVLMENARYAKCANKPTAAAVCDCIAAAGYATSKTYAKKLKGLISEYNLTAFDDMTEAQVKVAQSYLLYGKN